MCASGPQYIGSAACKACHPDVAGSFYKNPHFKLIAGGEEAPLHVGCESCHGPGAEHVAGNGDKTKIVAFSAMQPNRIIDACLKCHSNSIGRAQIRRSSHTQASIVCTSCHSIHHSNPQTRLLANEQTTLCTACHLNVRAEFALPFKHRVNEGFMACVDCHNPHGSAAPTWRMGARPRMVETALGNEEPCLRCHVDKRGPFAFEHAAVRVDGCEVCHQPHGSMNARLLRRPAVFTLCLECHNGRGNFGRRDDGIPITAAFHNMADPRFRNCTTCHVRIHGSNGDQFFLR